jgi:hypothetical protein
MRKVQMAHESLIDDEVLIRGVDVVPKCAHSIEGSPRDTGVELRTGVHVQVISLWKTKMGCFSEAVVAAIWACDVCKWTSLFFRRCGKWALISCIPHPSGKSGNSCTQVAVNTNTTSFKSFSQCWALYHSKDCGKNRYSNRLQPCKQ